MRQMHQQSFMVKSLSHTSKGREPTVPEVLVANMSDNEDSERRSQGSIEASINGQEEGHEISHYIQKHINEQASIQQMAQGDVSQSREEEMKQLEETQQILLKHQEFHLPR